MADETELEHRVDFQPDGNAGQAVSVTWRNCSVKTKTPSFLCWKSAEEAVTLLAEVSGSCRGKFFAVMGPSGAGKTTFLNLLAKRLASYETGPDSQTELGGHAYTTANLKAISGYVLADDVLFPHLTVRETLEYAAHLRMPRETTPEERAARVDEIIGRLGLEKCQLTLIGDSITRGVSGGERKRVCIALELLNRPRVLLCDSPTSGLDSATAYSVCQLLADLAHSGQCTVICTLNQPQIKIFNIIDDLLLLHDSHILYQGPPSNLLEAYAQAGFPCPVQINPADHLLDVISPLFREDIDHVRNNLARIKEVLEPCKATGIDEIAEKQPIDRDGIRLSWPQQFWVLLCRAALSQHRDWFSFVLQLFQTVIMGVLVGTVFLDIGTDQQSINKRQAVLFFCCINQGIFGSLLAVNSYPADRNVVLRERAAGTYMVSAYFLSKGLVELVSQLVYPFVFSAIVYWLVGLQADAGKFFLFVLFMQLCSLCAFSWALLTSAICVTVSASLSILPIVFDIFRLFGGFFLSPAELPSYFVWIDAVSYVKYAYTGISLNELQGLNYTCTPEQLSPPINGTCPVTSGQQTIDLLGLDYLSIGGCIGVLFGLLVTLRLLTYLAVRFNKA